jgi:hypothetical protein
VTGVISDAAFHCVAIGSCPLVQMYVHIDTELAASPIISFHDVGGRDHF